MKFRPGEILRCKMIMDGKTHELTKKDMATPVTVILGKNGRVKGMTANQKLAGQFKGMGFTSPGSLSQFGALPEGDLTVGESWSQNVPFPMGGGKHGGIGRRRISIGQCER